MSNYGRISAYRSNVAAPNPGPQAPGSRLVITNGGNGDPLSAAAFRPMPVQVDPPLQAPILDHQGHIVPQTMIRDALGLQPNNDVLDANNQGLFAQYLGQNPGDQVAEADVLQNITDIGHALEVQRNGSGFAQLSAYINQHAGALNTVNQLGGDNRYAVAGYYLDFILWYPVNICRAPPDSQRGNQPGNAIDVQVVKKVQNAAVAQILDPAGYLDPAAQGRLVENFANSAIALSVNVNQQTQIAFFAACNATLAHQGTAFGYYRFTWTQGANNVLVP
jgi:hypothetical protein